MTAAAASGPRLSLRIVPVTLANWQAVIALRLTAAQAGQLASNLYSLAEAYVEPRCQPRAIVAGRTVIGFLMYEYLPAERSFNIARFMIDRAWQGYGYGAAALAALVSALVDEAPEAAIMISVRPDNRGARALYERLGFVATGRRVHGEDVLYYQPLA